MPCTKLEITASTCLVATAALSLAVTHGSGPYGFEDPALDWLGRPSAIRAWADLAELLAAPAIVTALIVSFALGQVKRAFFRVAVYAVLALVALLVSDLVAKQLVHRTYYGELTFPSGNVTAVSATALAMWLALYPLLGERARKVALMIGVAWVLLMSLAVVGAALAHAARRSGFHLAFRRHRHGRRRGLRIGSRTLQEREVPRERKTAPRIAVRQGPQPVSSRRSTSDKAQTPALIAGPGIHARSALLTWCQGMRLLLI